MRSRTVIPLLLALMLAVPASASAAGWVTGPSLSPAGQVAVEPRVAVTPAGERVVAWQQIAPGANATVVRIAPPGGAFGAPQIFPTGDGEDLSLTSGSDGTVALAWTDTPSSAGTNLHLARLAPGRASFTEATPVPFGGEMRDAPHVAIQNGDVYVTVDSQRFDGNVESTAVRVVRLPAGASQVQAVNGPASANLDQASFDSTNQPGTTAEDSQIAIDGNAVQVIWDHLQDAPRGTTMSTTIVRRAAAPTGGGTFGAPQQVDSTSINSSRADSDEPVIAAGRGRLDAAWRDNGQINFQELTSGGPIQHIAAFATTVHAAIDPSGALVLGWQAFTTPDGVQAAFADTVPPGAKAGVPVRLTPVGGNRQLDDFVVGADGSALAVPDQANFFSSGDATERVQAAFRGPGGAFGGLEEVSGAQDRSGNAEFDTASGALGAGRVLIAWSADDSADANNPRVFLSERDAVPPSFKSISVPRGGVAGRTVSLSATATDTQSAVTVVWDFGDGDQGRGTSVTHAYSSPGTYTVRVTALDGAGNAMTQTRSIAVSAPADRTAPVVSGFSVTNKRFKVARGRTALIAARRRTASGTAFKLSLSERATVVVSITRAGRGRHRGGTLVRGGRAAGNVSIAFSGRLEGRALSAGTYLASVIAIDGSGNRSHPKTLKFTVISR
jgi:hypothetical protein